MATFTGTVSDEIFTAQSTVTGTVIDEPTAGDVIHRAGESKAGLARRRQDVTVQG